MKIPLALTRPLLAPASWLLRRWLGTLNYAYRPLGMNVVPLRPDLPGRYIYAMWHEYLLLPIHLYAGRGVHVLISQHRDAELLAQWCAALTIPVVRGSTTHGGVEALRQLLRVGTKAHLALTPDGPLGPRRRVQKGLVYLAARTGLEVVPVGFGLDRPRRLGSWDRFALPRPWSRARCVTAAPIAVAEDVDRNELESARLRVEEALNGATDLAERWAETDVWPEDMAAAA